MKKVFRTSYDVIHLWANSIQKEAHTSSHNVYYYDLDSIYSYGSHYELGKRETIEGNEVIIINDTGYSATTAKHIRELSSATSHKTVFYASEINPEYQLDSYIDSLSKARKPELYIVPALKLIERHEAYLSMFSKEPSAKFTLLKAAFSTGEWYEYYSKKVELMRLQEAERIAKQKLNHEREVKAFMDFESNYANRYNYDAKTYLRLNVEKERVETSQGIHIPFREAVVFYKAYLAGRKLIGTTLQGFTVISVEPMKIGCHAFDTEHFRSVGDELLKINKGKNENA